MIQSIYLHKPIVAVLSCYGDLNSVINRILEESAKGKFDLMDKPPCPDRYGAGRYNINITEPNYLELLQIYTPYSSKISLRRILYWFVENEIYNELGWKQIKKYEDKYEKLLRNKLNIALNELERAKKYAQKNVENTINNICNEIIDLQEYLDNEGQHFI